MSLAEFFRLIDAPPANAGASETDILAAEARLGGRLPDALRFWFREADGFPGEAGECMWRFWSLEELHAIDKIFPDARSIGISQQDGSVRQVPGCEYVVFCDALIYLPLYAVNIRADGLHFGEVILVFAGPPPNAYFVAADFERFAAFLFEHPGDSLLFPEG